MARKVFDTRHSMLSYLGIFPKVQSTKRQVPTVNSPSTTLMKGSVALKKVPDLVVKDMVFKKFKPSSLETFGRHYDLHVTVKNNGAAVKTSFYVRVLVIYAGRLSTDPNKFAWLMIDPDKKTNVSAKQILSLGEGKEQTHVWKNAVQENGQGYSPTGYSPILYIAVVDCPTSKAEAVSGAVAEVGGLTLASAPANVAEKNNTMCIFPPAK